MDTLNCMGSGSNITCRNGLPHMEWFFSGHQENQQEKLRTTNKFMLINERNMAAHDI